MIFAVDTNIILRLAHRTNPWHAVVRQAVRTIRGTGDELRSFPQILMEFWNVATRPSANNGLGLSVAQAQRQLRLVERVFSLLPESPTVYAEWRRLVLVFSVMGVRVHDAHIVAAMKVHGLTHVLTLNTADFARYASKGIQAVDPRSV